MLCLCTIIDGAIFHNALRKLAETLRAKFPAVVTLHDILLCPRCTDTFLL